MKQKKNNNDLINIILIKKYLDTLLNDTQYDLKEICRSIFVQLIKADCEKFDFIMHGFDYEEGSKKPDITITLVFEFKSIRQNYKKAFITSIIRKDVKLECKNTASSIHLLKHNYEPEYQKEVLEEIETVLHEWLEISIAFAKDQKLQLQID
jgi:hypothetical protein